MDWLRFATMELSGFYLVAMGGNNFREYHKQTNDLFTGA